MDMKRSEYIDEREQERLRAFMEEFSVSRELRAEGSRADVNELNRKNRELLAANVKLQDEIQALRRRLRQLGERV